MKRMEEKINEIYKTDLARKVAFALSMVMHEAQNRGILIAESAALIIEMHKICADIELRWLAMDLPMRKDLSAPDEWHNENGEKLWTCNCHHCGRFLKGTESEVGEHLSRCGDNRDG